MICLYVLSHWQLMVLLCITVISLLLQGYCMVYGLLRSSYQPGWLWGGLFDGCLLLLQWILTACIAETYDQARQGFFVGRSFPEIRYILFLLLLAAAYKRGKIHRESRELLGILGAVCLLPVIEFLLHDYTSAAILTGILLLTLYTILTLEEYGRKRKSGLSAFSVKEAMDTMHFGILFFRGEGSSAGQILLTNRKMQELMYTLTGKMLYSGDEFCEMLRAEQVLGARLRGDMLPNLVYEMEDGSVWRFERSDILSKGERCCLLLASDVSSRTRAVNQLSEQNQELERKNQELKEMLKNMEGLCRNEEMLRAKRRVHDLLGQQISLVLRSVREHREPDAAILKSFEKGLPHELKAAEEDCTESLRMVAESFQSLGVSVIISGEAPRDPEVQRVFFEISAEALTNAVHHGYATQVRISFENQDNSWNLKIRDNGRVKNLPIQEGGGLREMRRKTEQLGGQFSYAAASHFSILVTIPQEEVK